MATSTLDVRQAAPIRGGSAASTLREIPFDLIDAGPNDRQTFDRAALEELAASIAAHGLAQPPTLRPVGGRYEIVAGERRCRAMRDVLGWSGVHALVRDLDDETASAIMLAENVQRADLDPLEEARGYASRLERFGWTQAELARQANVPADRVRRRLALLALTPAVAHYVATRQLPLSFAACMVELDANRQALALAAFQSSPMAVSAFRVMCARLLGEQQSEPMFDVDSFLQIEEYVVSAEAAVAVPTPVTIDVVSEPVGVNEIAEMLRAKVNTVRIWRTRGRLPAPKWIVSGTPAWERDAIEAWARATGRWPDDQS